MSEEIRLRFAGSFVDGLEFVEAEDEDGNSVKVGTWERDGDYHILAFDPEVPNYTDKQIDTEK